MAEEKKPDISRIVDVALNSGLIDSKMTLQDIVRKVGGGVDEVAGYVAAWERYVLVVANAQAAELVIKQPGR